MVAGESPLMVKNRLEEVFAECSDMARGRGMGFSGLKTEWIGFGAYDWGSCRLDGVDVFPSSDLRVLGMRFAVDGKMGKQVDYWLERGLQVRARIGALARRFGGAGGIGAWEVMRLIQGAYMPVVEYGLEFVADDLVVIRRIEVHLRDCIRSLFRMPQLLANNILHSQCGIPPTGIRASYIRARCAQRFLNYQYCANFPWHGSIRNEWCLPDMNAVRMSSIEWLDTVPTFHIAPDKDTGLREGLLQINALAATDTVVGYVDGSHRGSGCGCACAAYRGCSELQLDSCQCGLPKNWDIDSCELFAILSLVRDVLALVPRRIVIFTDSQGAIKMLRNMKNDDTTSGLWEAFAPLFSRIPDITKRWIPGHMKIHGNQLVDGYAKWACDLALVPARRPHIDFGLGAYQEIRRHRLEQ